MQRKVLLLVPVVVILFLSYSFSHRVSPSTLHFSCIPSSQFFFFLIFPFFYFIWVGVCSRQVMIPTGFCSTDRKLHQTNIYMLILMWALLLERIAKFDDFLVFFIELIQDYWVYFCGSQKSEMMSNWVFCSISFLCFLTQQVCSKKSEKF